MKYAKIVFIFIFTMTSLVEVNAQEKLTLGGAITTALNQNTSVIKSTNSLDNNVASLKSAYGSFLPTMTLSSGWNWQRTSSSGTTVLDFFGNPQNLGATENDSRNYNVSLAAMLLSLTDSPISPLWLKERMTFRRLNMISIN